MNFRTWIRDNCFTYGYVPCVVFLGWLVDNQMWGRAAMLGYRDWEMSGEGLALD